MNFNKGINTWAPLLKILWSILKIEKGRTQTDGPEDILSGH